MKNIMMLLAVVMISLWSNETYAQRDLGFSVNIGLPTSITDGTPKFAISGGLVLEKSLTEKWSLEGQLNLVHLTYEEDNSPLAHNGGYNSFAVLSGGARYYWNSTSAKHPIYTNISIGGGYRFEEEYNADNILRNYDSVALLISSGTYVAVNNRIIVGLHFDTVTGGNFPAMILGAKVGVNF